VAERPRRRDLGAVGPPSGWSPARGCPDAGQAGRCPVRLVRSAVGMSVQPVERTSNVQASGVQVSRHPGVRTDKLRCPRRCRHAVRAAPDPGVARCGGPPPVGPNRSTCPVVAGGVVACRPRAGREGDGAALAVAGLHEVDRSPGRRLAGVPAAAPPWPRRAGTGAGPGQGAGRGRGAWDGAGAHRPRQGVLGALVGVVTTRGLDQQLVTTLRGRWARVVPWRPAPEGPPGSVGEQPAAVARPRCVGSAVG
jgi:hypothetical protein